MLLISEVKLPLHDDEGRLKEIIEKKLKCKVRYFEIHRKSLDARKDPHFVYSVIIDVDNEIFADLINTILLFINNYVKENIYKIELIKIKYNIIYVFERKENECIEYNFTTQNDLYWLTDFYCDVKDIPEDIKRACRNKRGYELYAMLIEDFIDKFDGIEKTYQEILLRTSLLFLNKDEALNIINEIMKIKNEADRLGINLQSGIFKVMESYEKDFLLPNIVRTRVKEK